ncbi:MAG: ExeA family protein [Candidatus Binatia bacterium]
MYTRHFGLTAEPFSLTPDPSSLYMSPGHAEALAALEIGLRSRRGLIVMTGEVGTGKTTLLYSILSRLGAAVRTAYILNTNLGFEDILQQALADFGVPHTGGGKLERLNALNAFLMQCAADGVTAALVIDEAQNLEQDTLEDLRLLSNYETFTAKLLQIVLVGQPELEYKLASPNLRQIADRVAVRCHVNPLNPAERRRYVAHRLRTVGGSITLFSPAALRLLLRKSRGVPRRINILCHNSLLFAYGRGAPRVLRGVARLAVRAKEGYGLVTTMRPGRMGSRSLRSRSRPALAAVGLLLLATLGATAAVRWQAGPAGRRVIAAAPRRPDPRQPGRPAPVLWFPTMLSVETSFAGHPLRTGLALPSATTLSVEKSFADSPSRARPEAQRG